MRITQQMLSQTALNGLQTNLRQLQNIQNQAVTGKRVSRPEDDPFAVEQSLGFRTRIDASEASRQNIAMSQDWLNATDKTMADMASLLTRTQSLAIKGGNQTLGPDELQALATELEQTLEQAVAIGNTRHGEHYLFSGFQVDTSPFEINRDATTGLISSVTYNGDSGLIQREIEPGTDMSVNVPGDTLFNDVFNTLINLHDALQSDPFVISDVTDKIAEIDTRLDSVLDIQAAVGTKVRRLESTANRMEQAEIGLRELLSKTEDADIAEVVSQLSQQQFVYQTALSVNGQVLRRSLLDYLR